MRFCTVIMAFSCLVKMAVAASTQCGSNSWQYQPTPFNIADHGQAYQVQLQSVKCHDAHTGEVEIVYSSQPIQRISQHNYSKAQQLYRTLGGQMGLQGDIIYESLYQPIVIQGNTSLTQAINLRVKVCLSRDVTPTVSSTFVNIQQLFDISADQPTIIDVKKF